MRRQAHVRIATSSTVVLATDLETVPMNLATAHLATLHKYHLPRDPEGDMPIHVPRGKTVKLSLTLYPEMVLHLGSISSQPWAKNILVHRKTHEET